ncbi:unnamed protein product [Cuscuta europaea]|uniref:Uncharacterized protein n=1 Tax=Cuscuta europaea TaxID=41803 RepID=A0A9P0ZAK6_CUSEU|nr:unnamed protein product [Cuscuta europaea]
MFHLIQFKYSRLMSCSLIADCLSMTSKAMSLGRITSHLNPTCDTPSSKSNSGYELFPHPQNSHLKSFPTKHHSLPLHPNAQRRTKLEEVTLGPTEKLETGMEERALKLKIPLKDYFPAQYSVCGKYNEASNLIKSCLSAKQLQLFRQLSWGHLVDVPKIQFSAQIVHVLLLRLVEEQPEDELWFCVQGKVLKFTFAVYCHITGPLQKGGKHIGSKGRRG